MVPPPWLEFTTSEPSFSATRVSPPGTMVTWLLPVSTNGRRSTWRGARPDCGAGRAGRQRQRRLGDETFGLALELVAERLDRRLGRGRSDQHAVAAGAVHFLHHQFGEIVEHVGEILGLAAAPGRHVLQDRFFAEIEFHDLGHVGVDRLVVGDAGADRVGQRDVAGRIGRHQPGHAERGIRAEGEGIEEVVVDPAVDHVDALQALGGAHEHLIVLDDEVAALDQLDAELVGEERVLVIGGIVDAGRHQRHRRLGRGGQRRHRAQRRQQFVRILFHRRDAVAGEQVRKQPHHDFAVFQHVGHARGRARIVLQHEEVFRVDADDVDAGDVDIDVVRHVLAVHLGPEHRVLEDQVVGDDIGAQDVAAVIDVAQEHVERAHPLLQAFFEDAPIPSPDMIRGITSKGISRSWASASP